MAIKSRISRLEIKMKPLELKISDSTRSKNARYEKWINGEFHSDS